MFICDALARVRRRNHKLRQFRNGGCSGCVLSLGFGRQTSSLVVVAWLLASVRDIRVGFGRKGVLVRRPDTDHRDDPRA